MACKVLVKSNIRGLSELLKKSLKTDINWLDDNTDFGSIKEDEKKGGCTILVADNPFIMEALNSSAQFGFIQGTWAGVDSIMKDLPNDFTIPSIPICRFAHPSFSQLIGEYVTGQIIRHERGLDEIREWQLNQYWPLDEEKRLSRCLHELTVGVLGFGNMGRSVAKLCKAYGCKVWAMKRTKSSSEESVDHIVDMDELHQLLENCDYICNVLPSTEKTNNCLNGDILSFCHGKNVVFVNVGRANVISDDCLLKALENNWLSAAILDVFHQEPLPKNHPFWKHPKITITPHVSALSRPQDIAECFAQNLDHFIKGQPLKHVIDWNERY